MNNLEKRHLKQSTFRKERKKNVINFGNFEYAISNYVKDNGEFSRQHSYNLKIPIII